jgi:hypothetical protein
MHGFLTLLAPPVDRVLGPLPGNDGEVVYDSLLMSRLALSSNQNLLMPDA